MLEAKAGHCLVMGFCLGLLFTQPRSNWLCSSVNSFHELFPAAKRQLASIFPQAPVATELPSRYSFATDLTALLGLQ